jgi:hypothetical protein
LTDDQSAEDFMSKVEKRWMRWLASIPWTSTRPTKIWWNIRGE